MRLLLEICRAYVAGRVSSSAHLSSTQTEPFSWCFSFAGDDDDDDALNGMDDLFFIIYIRI